MHCHVTSSPLWCHFHLQTRSPDVYVLSTVAYFGLINKQTLMKIKKSKSDVQLLVLLNKNSQQYVKVSNEIKTDFSCFFLSFSFQKYLSLSSRFHMHSKNKSQVSKKVGQGLREREEGLWSLAVVVGCCFLRILC